MKRIVALVFGPALLVSACGGGTDTESWTDVAATLTSGVDESSDNICVRGDPACIELVISEMTDRLAPLESSCDHDAAFALMYLRMTETVAAEVAGGSFEDVAFLNHLDAMFADFYFDAFDAWHSGDTDSVAPAWQVAFESAAQGRVSGIGNLLLGANAHIRRDLAFVMEAVGIVGADGSSRRPDYDRINPIIEQLARPLLGEVAARLDPSIALFDIPLLDFDERTAGAVLAAWRTEAIEDAARLLAAGSTEGRDEVAAEIDAKAEATAQLIRLGTGYPPLLPGAFVRDNLCRLAK